MATFVEGYWGKACQGFSVIGNNTKKGWKAATELQDFLRDSAAAEEARAKDSQRIIRSFSADVGVHTAIWNSVRRAATDTGDVHQSTAQKLAQLKEKTRATEDSRARQAQLLKESQIPRLMETMNQSQATLNKAMKKAAKKEKRTSGGTDELMTKHRKDVEDYEAAMIDFCERMQGMETENADRMGSLVRDYVDTMTQHHLACMQVLETLSAKLQQQTGDFCVRQLVGATGTGSDRPTNHLGNLELDPSALDSTDTTFAKSDSTATTDSKDSKESSRPKLLPSGLMKGMGLKKKGSTKRDSKDVKRTSSISGSIDSSASNPADSQPANIDTISESGAQLPATVEGREEEEEADVDEEGYRVRKDTPQQEERAKDSFDSDSEEEDGPKKRFMVKIRDPAQDGQAAANEGDSSLFKLEIGNPTHGAGRQRRHDQQQGHPSPSQFSLPPPSPSPTPPPAPLPATSSVAGRNLDLLGFDPLMGGQAPSSVPNPGTSSPPPILSPASSLNSVQSFRRANVTAKVALTETINAYFKGPQLGKVVVTGQLVFAFPPNIREVLSAESGPLVLHLDNMAALSNVTYNDRLVVDTEGGRLSVDAWKLLAHINDQQAAQADGGDIRVTLLSYSVTATDLSVVPLRLCSVWRCEGTTTHYTLHYMYNRDATSVPLTGISVLVQLAGGTATDCQSTPGGQWSQPAQRLMWNVPQIAATTADGGKGQLTATFTVDGPSVPSKVLVKLASTGTTLSKVDVRSDPTSSVSFGSPIRRFTAGKYISDV